MIDHKSIGCNFEQGIGYKQLQINSSGRQPTHSHPERREGSGSDRGRFDSDTYILLYTHQVSADPNMTMNPKDRPSLIASPYSFHKFP